MLMSRERKSTILEGAALHGNCHHLSKHEQRNPTPAVYGWTTGWGSQSNHLLWGASTGSNVSWNKKHHQDKSKGDHSGFVNGKVKFDGYFITAFVLKKIEWFFITFLNVWKIHNGHILYMTTLFTSKTDLGPLFTIHWEVENTPSACHVLWLCGTTKQQTWAAKTKKPRISAKSSAAGRYLVVLICVLNAVI